MIGISIHHEWNLSTDLLTKESLLYTHSYCLCTEIVNALSIGKLQDHRTNLFFKITSLYKFLLKKDQQSSLTCFSDQVMRIHKVSCNDGQNVSRYSMWNKRLIFLTIHS